MNPTIEQLEIINAVKRGERLLKIEAVAGSGKTSTGVLIEKYCPANTLYVAFNKASAQDAEKKFPSNTKCRTFHSIAYQHMQINKTYAHKLTRKPNKNCGQYANEIAKLLKVKDYAGVHANTIGELIKSSVACYQQSADSALSDSHVKIPRQVINTMSEYRKVPYEPISSVVMRDITTLKKKVKDYATTLWEYKIDKGSDVVIDHDTYFKLFQLTKPILDYDRIFLDEAQDTTDCALDIILNQDCQVIIVGDNRQSIYEWRGACNAMFKIKDAITLRLSKSWRYGNSIATVAEKIANMPIVGNEIINSTIKVLDNEKYTYIFRTNAELISTACDLIAEQKNVLIDIDTTEFLRKLKSVIALRDDRQVLDIDVASYGNWNNFCTSSKPPELDRLYKLVVNNKHTRIINYLTSYKKPNNPDIRLITAHRSKGLEYENVKLADDFPVPIMSKASNMYSRLTEQEENLLYVAVTRAINTLEINSSVKAYINYIA